MKKKRAPIWHQRILLIVSLVVVGLIAVVILFLSSTVVCIENYPTTCTNGLQQEVGITLDYPTIAPELVKELATARVITATYSAKLCETYNKASDTIATVITDSAELFSNPDPLSDLVKIVNKGEQFHIITSENKVFVTWYLVMDKNDQCFWISEINIEITD